MHIFVVRSSLPPALEPSWLGLAISGLDTFLPQGQHPCPSCRGERCFSPVFPKWIFSTRSRICWASSTPEAFNISSMIRDVPTALLHFISLTALITSWRWMWGAGLPWGWLLSPSQTLLMVFYIWFYIWQNMLMFIYSIIIYLHTHFENIFYQTISRNVNDSCYGTKFNSLRLTDKVGQLLFQNRIRRGCSSAQYWFKDQRSFIVVYS